MGLLDGFKKLKRYIANEHGDYQLVSLWTHASTVVMDGDVSLKDSLDSKVNKTGDTLTGGLSINSSSGSGNIVLKDTGFALDTSSTNGVAQGEPRFKLLGAYDSNGRRFGVFQFAARDDGETDVAMVATNMKTNGDTWAGGIWASAEKDGTMNYSITQPAKFKEAIGLTDIGKITTNEKDIALPATGALVKGASVALSAGSYVVTAWCLFQSANDTSAPRITQVRIMNNAASTQYTSQSIHQSDSSNTSIQATAVIRRTQQETVIIKAASSKACDCSTTITAMKISD